MARLDFKLPDMGEGVTEGEIVEWFVGPGDTLGEDDPMVEVMTDKATVTIGAPCDAQVVKVCFAVGAVARVGDVILTLESDAASNVGAAQRSSRPPAWGPGRGCLTTPQPPSAAPPACRSRAAPAASGPWR